MLDRTTVYCAGEFGRTPKINKNNGRDHWARSMAVVLAGGGFRRGYAHGSTDAQGMAPAVDPCTPDDVASTIFQQLGIDPHTELQTPTGRPMQLFREGRVVSRAMLLQHVWDLHFDPSTNIIDVYVGRVRRKVDDRQAYPLIHTVRGVGYCLRAPG